MFAGARACCRWNAGCQHLRLPGRASISCSCGRTDGSKTWEVSTRRFSRLQETVVVCVTEGLDARQVVQWDKRPIYVPNCKLMSVPR